MVLKSLFLICFVALWAAPLPTAAQFYDYSALQTSVNELATQAEQELQAMRLSISEYVLATTDDMITYATNSLAEGGDDPRAPMIGACTLYPTNYLSFYTKELNVQVATAQGQVNALKFAVLKALVQQNMISEAAATYAKVQAEVATLSTAWPEIKARLQTEIATFEGKVAQLVLDMQECIEIAGQ